MQQCHVGERQFVPLCLAVCLRHMLMERKLMWQHCTVCAFIPRKKKHFNTIYRRLSGVCESGLLFRVHNKKCALTSCNSITCVGWNVLCSPWVLKSTDMLSLNLRVLWTAVSLACWLNAFAMFVSIFMCLRWCRLTGCTIWSSAAQLQYMETHSNFP